MKVKERAQGIAMSEENNLAREKNIGIERVPKIKGMIRRSLSGFLKG
jgi:hypothetical protein